MYTFTLYFYITFKLKCSGLELQGTTTKQVEMQRNIDIYYFNTNWNIGSKLEMKIKKSHGIEDFHLPFFNENTCAMRVAFPNVASSASFSDGSWDTLGRNP